VYLHPNSPSAGLIQPERSGGNPKKRQRRDVGQPLLQRGLDGALYGLGVAAGMHLLAIITSGVFDRFPKLKLVVCHLGQALTYCRQWDARKVFGL
jgi:5-carboxyvanillate decarboxylase